MIAHKTLAVAKSLAIHLMACWLIYQPASSKIVTPIASIYFKEKTNSASLEDNQSVNLESRPTNISKKFIKKLKKTIKNSGPINNSLGINNSSLDLATKIADKEIRHSPVLLNKHEAQILYPEKARLLMIEGSVFLRLTISELGKVIKAEVLSGHYDLRKAALKLANKLFFLPATDSQGEAKMALVEHEVVFKLKQS
jgi:TonB family protein